MASGLGKKIQQLRFEEKEVMVAIGLIQHDREKIIIIQQKFGLKGKKKKKKILEIYSNIHPEKKIEEVTGI